MRGWAARSWLRMHRPCSLQAKAVLTWQWGVLQRARPVHIWAAGGLLTAPAARHAAERCM